MKDLPNRTHSIIHIPKKGPRMPHFSHEGQSFYMTARRLQIYDENITTKISAGVNSMQHALYLLLIVSCL